MILSTAKKDYRCYSWKYSMHSNRERCRLQHLKILDLFCICNIRSTGEDKDLFIRQEQRTASWLFNCNQLFYQHLFIHVIPSCVSSNPLVSAVRMSSASGPAQGCCLHETMLEEEEEGPLVQLHPRSIVRSLNGKALNLSGVIWTVLFWSTSSSTPATPDPKFPSPKLPSKHISSYYVSIRL